MDSVWQELGNWCDLAPSPDSPTSMGSLAYGEDVEEEKNSGACFGVKCGVWGL